MVTFPVRYDPNRRRNPGVADFSGSLQKGLVPWTAFGALLPVGICRRREERKIFNEFLCNILLSIISNFYQFFCDEKNYRCSDAVGIYAGFSLRKLFKLFWEMEFSGFNDVVGGIISRFAEEGDNKLILKYFRIV